MQHYLSQLISDMRLAVKRAPRTGKEEFDPEVMMELEESEEKPMGYWLGFNKEQFPPSERLNDDQLKLMANEFEQLWAAYSFYPDFPEGLPAKRRYELMRDYIDHPTQYWPGGWEHHFEFCHYDPAHCPFGSEFCRCKEWEDDQGEIKA